jgi:glycyl-tRNA synthetase beta chain
MPLSPTLSPEGEREKLADMAERAARLAKADLVTGMVGEFPELQGLMGGYYAAAQGEPAEVAEAIRDHYKPVGQGDEVPTAPVTVAVSLADKLDTLLAFYLIDEKPTGSKDPFALRRAMLAIIRLILTNGIRTQLTYPVRMAMILNIIGLAYREYVPLNEIYKGLQGLEFEEAVRQTLVEHGKLRKEAREQELIAGAQITAHELGNFLAERLKVQQREAGVRHDLIDAVFALGNQDDLVLLLARVHALQAFVTSADGKNLLAGYKRAANILKKEEWAPGEVADNEIYEAEPAEAALREALDAAEPKAEAAIEAEDFEAAMAALASLRGPIDKFFDDVTVVDKDQFKREMRLGLLARIRDAVNNVADFSKIEG